VSVLLIIISNQKPDDGSWPGYKIQTECLLVLFYVQKPHKNMIFKHSFRLGLLIILEAGDTHQTEGCRSSEYLPGRP
jgi:hypothetical protein